MSTFAQLQEARRNALELESQLKTAAIAEILKIAIEAGLTKAEIVAGFPKSGKGRKPNNAKLVSATDVVAQSAKKQTQKVAA